MRIAVDPDAVRRAWGVVVGAERLVGPPDGCGAAEMNRLRRAVGLGLVCAGLCLTTAASCTPEDRLIYPDELDVARLTQMQNDPWLAPDDVRLWSEASTSTAHRPLRRPTVQRGYATSMVPGDIAMVEVGAAQRVGWQVTGATCRSADLDGPGGVVVSLRKDQGGPMTAWVQVGMARVDPAQYLFGSWPGDPVPSLPPGAGPGVPLGDPTPSSEHPTWVEVVGLAPYHVDQWWLEQRPVDVEDTCLGGGSPGVAAQPDPGEEPLVREGERLPRTAARPWSSGLPPDLLQAMAETDADTVLDALGVTVTPDPHEWEEDHATRRFPRGESERSPVPSTTLADVVDQATGSGWALTYTGCWSSGLTLAELRRPVGQRYSAVLRLTQVPDLPGPGQATLTVRAQMTSPAWYGPAVDRLDPVSQVCATPTDQVFVWDGTPWFGPSQLAPVQTGR
ncbi:MAG: hypothetical protein FWH11_11555 [Micrococcales bacterium]|nr:hypothetical protein [Micrococcales bacterium]